MMVLYSLEYTGRGSDKNSLIEKKLFHIIEKIIKGKNWPWNRRIRVKM